MVDANIGDTRVSTLVSTGSVCRISSSSVKLASLSPSLSPSEIFRVCMFCDYLVRWGIDFSKSEFLAWNDRCLEGLKTFVVNFLSDTEASDYRSLSGVYSSGMLSSSDKLADSRFCSR